ncbi:MAG: patatin-like phospholipase family protein [Gemmatimonadetes bacterium]|nr:patatin-like phospholipase family protein [Gemmatimonadota bacterium]
MPTQPSVRPGGLGLALSDGGAKALAQLGVLRVLEREAIPIGYLAGSSTGALIAAVFATSRDVR